MRYNDISQYQSLIRASKRLPLAELKECLADRTLENKHKILLGNLKLIAKVVSQRTYLVDEFDLYFSTGIEAMVIAINRFSN